MLTFEALTAPQTQVSTGKTSHRTHNPCYLKTHNYSFNLHLHSGIPLCVRNREGHWRNKSKAGGSQDHSLPSSSFHARGRESGQQWAVSLPSRDRFIHARTDIQREPTSGRRELPSTLAWRSVTIQASKPSSGPC